MSDHVSPVKARRRGDVVFAVAVVVAVALLAWIVITITQLSHDLRTANDARDALARQVQGLGASPVAGSPGSRGDIGPTGVAGPSGPSGPSGPVGATGPTGPSGKSGSPGESWTPGQIGASGSPGSTGAAGDVGPSGPAGAQGDPGAAGADGQDGSDGSPPAGWSYPWTDGTGVTHHVTCTRTADSPDSDPQYDCEDTSTDTPAPTDSPSPNHGLLGVGAVASTAAYRRIGGTRAQ